MKYKYIVPDLLIIVFVSNCSDTIYQPLLTDEFDLNVGEQKLLIEENLIIGFKEVISDSRCPTGLQCYWAGNGKISLWLYKQSYDTLFFDLNTYLEPQEADYSVYTIHLVELNPYPSQDVPIDFSGYKVTLLVSKIRYK